METTTRQEKRLNNAIHGNIYQLKVLMLFLFRGVSNHYSFRLGTEIEEAHKFDDLVFEYIQKGRKIYRLLQAKHRLDETKKITSRQLLSEIKGDYSLIKYFFSFRQAKKEQLFKDGSIRDVTICTNIDFDFEDLKKSGISLEKLTDEDDILDVVNNKKQPSRFKINKSVISLLKQKILEVGQQKSLSTFLESEIHDFLSHLVFAVNQPNEEELGDILKNEIGREFDWVTTDIVYNKFLIRMLNWLQGKEDGVFLSFEEGKQFFEEVRKGMPIWFGLQEPNESFVGRGRQLKELHELLHCDGEEGTKTIAITGLGGVGKSELARTYAKTYSSLHDDKVVWIHAETYQSLVHSFHRLACDALRISTKNANGEEKEISSIVEDVYRFFSKGKSLFIFDNAERFKTKKDYDQGLDKFLPGLPLGCKKPHIIITTRNKKWTKAVKVLLLDAFTPEESEEFICKTLDIQISTERDDVNNLVAELEFFPLALQQAVAYIKVQYEKLNNVGSCFKVKDYLKRYSTGAQELLDFEFPEDSDINYTKTMMKTWMVTFNEIALKDCGPDALKIMDILAYVSADNIPIKMFSELVGDAEKLGSAIELLKQYSIITSVRNRKLNVHRLLQKVLRIQLANCNKEKDVLVSALNLFNKGSLNLENVDHAISVWNYSSKHSEIVSSYSEVCSAIPTVLLNALRWQEAYSFSLQVTELFKPMLPDGKIVGILIETKLNTAKALMQLGIYRMALNDIETAHACCTLVLGPEHLDTLIVEYHMADALRMSCKYDEALKYYEKAYCGLQIKLGEYHKDTLLAKAGIAEIYNKKGKYESSLKMYNELHVIQKAQFGKNSSGTMYSRGRIAQITFDMGRHNEALSIFRDICEYQVRTLGKNHPDTLKTRMSIANILSTLGSSETLNQYEEILASQKLIYGEHHSVLLCTLDNMAKEMSRQDRHEEALKLYTETYNKRVLAYGPDHPDTLRTRGNIGLTHEELGKPKEALAIFQEVLSKEKQILGNDHLDTIMMELFVAQVLAKLGNFDQSFQHFKKVKQRSTIETPLKLNQQFNIAVLFYNKGKYDQALDIFHEVLAKQRTILKPDDPELMVTQRHIAMVLEQKNPNSQVLTLIEDEVRKMCGNDNETAQVSSLHLALLNSKQGRPEKAIALCRKVMEGIIPGAHFCSEEKLSTLNSVAGELYNQNKYNEALEIYQFIIKNQFWDDDDPILLQTQSNLASVLIELHSYAQASKILHEIMPRFRTTFGEKHCETMDIIHKIATTYTKTGQFLKAQGPYEELLKYQKNTLGENHYETIKSEHNLGLIYYELRNHKQALQFLSNVLKKARRLYPTDSIVRNTEYCIEMITKEGGKYSQLPKNNVHQRNTLKGKADNLWLVIMERNVEKLGELLKRGGNVNSKDENNRTLLHRAVDMGCVQIVESLLEHGADMTTLTNKGNTPLHIATARGFTNIVELLLKHEKGEALCDFINVRTVGGGTSALHVAAQRGHYEIVVSLLKHGGSFEARNWKGQIPIDLATDEAIVGLLQLTSELFECAAQGDESSLIPKLKNVDSHLKNSVMNARNSRKMTLLQVAILNHHNNLASQLSKMLKGQLKGESSRVEFQSQNVETKETLLTAEDL